MSGCLLPMSLIKPTFKLKSHHQPCPKYFYRLNRNTRRKKVMIMIMIIIRITRLVMYTYIYEYVKSSQMRRIDSRYASDVCSILSSDCRSAVHYPAYT